MPTGNTRPCRRALMTLLLPLEVRPKKATFILSLLSTFWISCVLWVRLATPSPSPPSWAACRKAWLSTSRSPRCWKARLMAALACANLFSGDVGSRASLEAVAGVAVWLLMVRDLFSFALWLFPSSSTALLSCLAVRPAPGDSTEPCFPSHRLIQPVSPPERSKGRTRDSSHAS